MTRFNKNKEHILVCFTPSSFHRSLYALGQALSTGLECQLSVIAVVDFEYDGEINDELNQILIDAKREGAHVSILNGTNAAYQISEFAKVSQATKIIIGVDRVKGWHISRVPLAQRITTVLPYLEVITLPITERATPKRLVSWEIGIYELVVVKLALVITWIIGYWMIKMNLHDTNVLIVFLISTVLISLYTSYRFLAISFTMISIFIYNYMFVHPQYTLQIFEKAYVFTFILMLLVSQCVFELSRRVKAGYRDNALRTFRNELLLHSTLRLQMVHDKEAAIHEIGTMLSALIETDVVIYYEANDLKKQSVFYSKEVNAIPYEPEVVQWVFQNVKKGGKGTNIYPDSTYSYFAIRSGEDAFGVVGVDLRAQWHTELEDSFLTLINELGIVLQSLELTKQLQEKETKQAQDRVRHQILSTISHDLRTPLTSLRGNSEWLYQMEPLNTKLHAIYHDLYFDTLWLSDIVDNILLLNRFEGDDTLIPMDAYVVSDLVEEAVDQVKQRYRNRSIVLTDSAPVTLIEGNAQLLVQLFMNLIENAIKFSQETTNVEVSISATHETITISIRDFGVGIEDTMKPYIFDMFYTQSSNLLNSKKGMGLGLYLCKAIVDAHKGNLIVLDNIPNGTVFEVSLRKRELYEH